MTILSNWRLIINPTTTPVVAVEIDDELTEEPEFGLRVGLSVVPIKYGTPFLELTAGDIYSFSFTKVNYAATDAEARQAMMESLTDTYGALGKVPLRLTIRGLATRRYDFSEAVFDNPRVRRLTNHGGDGRAAWSLAHTVTAKALAKTVIP